MHCCLKRNNQFIDVRGETSDFNNIIDEFDYGEFIVKEFATLTEFEQLLNKLEIF